MISKLTTEANKSLIDDDIFMVVRKQLSSNNLKYKRLGVVGGLAMLSAIFEVQQSSLQDPNSGDGISETDFQQV